MGLVEKFFAWGAKKTIAQAYHAGVGSVGRLSNGAKWNRGTSSHTPITTIDHYSSRAQARQKYFDSSVAKGVIDRFTDMVIDRGLRLEPMPNAEILGITEDQALEWAENTKTQFHLWAKSKKSTRSETLNYYQFQRLACLSQQRDGEYFARFNYSNRRDLINPLQMSFVDPQQIRGDSLTTSTGPFAQEDGIIRDAGGKEKAYKIWLQKQDKPYQYEEKEIPAKGPKSGRTFMIHGFMPEFAGQGRGYTKLMHAIQDIEILTNYQLAELNKAGNQANIFASVKPSDNAPASNPLQDIAQDTTNPNAQQTQTITSEVEPLQFNPLKEATINEPGSIFVANLQPGEELEAFKSSISAEDFSKFQDAVVEYMAPSINGMPLEVLKMKFANNYSASRATLILAYRIYEIWRDEQNADLNNPVYEAWLSEMIAMGRITATGWNDPLKRAAWLENTWLGAPMPNIDPQRTAQAEETYMKLGATTPDKVAINLNGSSAKKNIAKNNQLFEQMDLPPWEKNASASETSNNKINNDDEEE